MGDVSPIRTAADYEAALPRVEGLMDAEAGTPEGEELDLLARLIEVYEEKHHAIDLPDPIAAIRFRMEQGGLSK
jgi:HTH-type transcriptional regulator/antitoxin HigA